jgi:glutamate-1-semialdehyde 2,1-aminomutase
LEKLFNDFPNQIACVILEPMEFDLPIDNFLHKIKDLCKNNGAVFVLDEMITGFKLGFPGAHSMLGVEPDLTTWGKGVANGYSTCMLAGKREIMELGGLQHDKERVFLISTTHGAETHSLAAAIATIKYTKENNTVDSDFKKGEYIKEKFQALIEKHNLKEFIEIKGHPCWLLTILKNSNSVPCDGMKTLLFQEMIKRGVFFRGVFNISISHTYEDIDNTMDAFDGALQIYKKALHEGYENYLIGEPIKPVFRKYN